MGRLYSSARSALAFPPLSGREEMRRSRSSARAASVAQARRALLLLGLGTVALLCEAAAGGCPSGTFKVSEGATGCSACPSSLMSLPGSTSDGDCGVPVSFITFSATIRGLSDGALSTLESESDNGKGWYVAAVAKLLEVAEHFVDVSFSAAKGWDVVIQTRVTVPADHAEGLAALAARITKESLNAEANLKATPNYFLNLPSFTKISDVSTASGDAGSGLSGGGIATMVISGIAALVLAWWWRRRNRDISRVGDDGLDHDGDLEELVRSAAASLGSEFRVNGDDKFAPTDLVFGKYDQAAAGLPYFLCVENQELFAKMGQQEYAIVQEIQTFGTDSDKVLMPFSARHLHWPRWKSSLSSLNSAPRTLSRDPQFLLPRFLLSDFGAPLYQSAAPWA